MQTFRFTHPDPDKVFRFERRLKLLSGLVYKKDVDEYKRLCLEWVHYYVYLGNRREAERQKRRMLLNLKRIQAWPRVTTINGAAFARPKEEVDVII